MGTVKGGWSVGYGCRREPALSPALRAPGPLHRLLSGVFMEI